MLAGQVIVEDIILVQFEKELFRDDCTDWVQERSCHVVILQNPRPGKHARSNSKVPKQY